MNAKRKKKPLDLSPIKLEIHATAYGGKGVARHEGKVYFVAGTVPGDQIYARVHHDTERFAEATVTTVISPSALRGPVPCDYAGRCGGCQWLGIATTNQEQWKSEFITSALSRIGRLQTVPLEFFGAPSSLAYRNRIQLKCRSTPNSGGLECGYYAPMSHELVAIERCAIADSTLNAALSALKSVPLPLVKGDFHLEMMVAADPLTQESGVLLTAIPQFSADFGALKPWLESLSKKPPFLWCGLIGTGSEAPFFLWDQQFGVSFMTRPEQFQQVNRPHNQKLRSLVRDEVLARKAAFVLDLHCGSGNLSLGLLDGHCQVKGIEASPTAIAAARESLRVSGLTGGDYQVADATLSLRRAVDERWPVDLVLLDPPREGLKEGVTPLLALLPETIFYVSCDPTTLARDLGTLCQTHYKIEKLAAFDFFPNTYHVETMAVLVRRDL